MGYCTFCKKDVYSTVTCNYCNNVIAPRMDSKLLEQRRHTLGNTDKWQDTYSKKSFFNNNNLSSSTKSNFMSSTRKKAIPQFNTTQETNLKSCSQCFKNQTSWSDQNFTIYKSIYYCKPCLAEKLKCPKCSNPVKIMDSQISFQRHTYHSDCFQCFQCATSLCDKDAVENAKGQPFCTSCQPIPPIEKLPSPVNNPSTSTPLLNSRSTTANVTNPLPFQRTRRSSMFSRNLPLDSPTPTSTLLDKIKERNARATISESKQAPAPIVINRNYTMSTPLLQQQQPQLPKQIPKKTESTNALQRKKKTIKKPCKECGEHVSKKDYRGLKTLSGEVVCFHTFCLKCARCYQSFDGLEFCTDGKNFYHTKCPVVSDRKGSPCSLSEEDCPKTPPPTENNPHFDVVSGSPILLPNIDQQNNGQNKKEVITPDLLPTSSILCDTCKHPVTDTYLELCDRFYHQECLLCAGCKNSIPAKQKLRKLKDNQLYCEGCATKKRNNSIFLSNLVTSSDNLPKRVGTITSPSDIFKSRSTNLPRLGGCRTCDGCKMELPVLDSHPGPNATRWHKKCLKCPGCKKQMDSSGHIKTDRNTKISEVHCRECLDNMPRYNFVR